MADHDMSLQWIQAFCGKLSTAVPHQQTSPPLYRAYTGLYSGTGPTERFLLLQTLTSLYTQTYSVILCGSSVHLSIYGAVQSFMRLKILLHRIGKHA